MAAMKDFLIEVEYLFDEGYSVNQISSLTGQPLSLVNDAIANILDERDQIGTENDMEALYGDTDDAYALASIGWGTDEDYGYYGEE